MDSPAKQTRWTPAALASVAIALAVLILFPGAVPASHGGGNQRLVRARTAGRVRLFGADPELESVLSELPAAAARAAGQMVVESWCLKPGSWDPAADPELDDPDCSYLVLEGLLLSRVQVGSRSSAELLGAGDLFSSDDADTSGYATVASKRIFRVLEPTTIVALDPGLLARLHSLPGMARHFQHRLTLRARSLNVRLAIVKVPRLTTRLQLLLWHLADRWGRRRHDGAVVPFRLPHGVLADCVSAQRTSVVVAMHELEKSGVIERNDAGHWVLHAEPPVEFT